MMQRTLVGTRQGKRAINWPAVLLTGLVVGVVSGSSAGGVWFLLTKEFSIMTVVFAAAAAIGWFIGEVVRRARRLPLDQLPPLD